MKELISHKSIIYIILEQISHTDKNSNIIYCITAALIIILSSAQSDAQAYPTFIQNTIVSEKGSPIEIYRDSYSPTSLVHIVIHAPDFNSNPYAIDTIGEDFANQITISTRESSIPYRLVETGPDTGVFAGYVTLSGTTSTCSPVCGPNDGVLAASGDDAITVSFSYAKGKTITSTIGSQDNIINATTPEFGSIAGLVITISIIGVTVFSRRFVKN